MKLILLILGSNFFFTKSKINNSQSGEFVFLDQDVWSLWEAELGICFHQNPAYKLSKYFGKVILADKTRFKDRYALQCVYRLACSSSCGDSALCWKIYNTNTALAFLNILDMKSLLLVDIRDSEKHLWLHFNKAN